MVSVPFRLDEAFDSKRRYCLVAGPFFFPLSCIDSFVGNNHSRTPKETWIKAALDNAIPPRRQGMITSFSNSPIDSDEFIIVCVIHANVWYMSLPLTNGELFSWVACYIDS